MDSKYVKELQTETAQGIICPECFKELKEYSVISNKVDRYGRELRTYYGWCISCELGSEVVQFRQNNKWHIHKHRYYAVTIETDKPLPSREWQIVNELPEPAPVVIGPGGNYDKQINLDSTVSLKSVHQILRRLLLRT